MQQDLELELHVTDTAGCTLGHIWRRDEKGKTTSKYVDKATTEFVSSHPPSLRTDALPCGMIVDELGLRRPPRYNVIAGSAKGNADATATTRRSRSGEMEGRWNEYKTINLLWVTVCFPIVVGRALALHTRR